MKAEDLMIGDWVLHDREPYQIRQLGVYGVDRDGEDYPAVCIGKPKGVGLIVERKEIEPIPLTPEILEKNGFVNYDEGDLRYRLSCGDIIGIDILGDFAYLEDADLKYVHELQHALRLCGIEKTIVL